VQPVSSPQTPTCRSVANIPVAFVTAPENSSGLADHH
jgi:hypothetical protein